MGKGRNTGLYRLAESTQKRHCNCSPRSGIRVRNAVLSSRKEK